MNTKRFFSKNVLFIPDYYLHPCTYMHKHVGKSVALNEKKFFYLHYKSKSYTFAASKKFSKNIDGS